MTEEQIRGRLLDESGQPLTDKQLADHSVRMVIDCRGLTAEQIVAVRDWIASRS